MKPIGNVIKSMSKQKKQTTSTSNTSKQVNKSTSTSNTSNYVSDKTESSKHIGKQLAEGLDAVDWLNYYVILAHENNHQRLMQALSITKEADEQGIIRIEKSVYFLAILKRWKLKTKFKKGV